MQKKRRVNRRKKAPPFPLREILNRKKLSQYEAAKRCGMTDQQMSDLVRGRRQPNWSTLIHVLTSIGAELGDLAPKGGAA